MNYFLEQEPIIKSGKYLGELKEVRESISDSGKKFLVLSFSLYVEEDTLMEKDFLIPINLRINSLFHIMAKKFDVFDSATGKIDFESIVGNAYELTLAENEKDGRKYLNIADARIKI